MRKTITFDLRDSTFALGDVTMFSSVLKALRHADEESRVEVVFNDGFSGRELKGPILDGLVDRLDVERAYVSEKENLNSSAERTVVPNSYIADLFPQRPELLANRTFGREMNRLHFVDAQLAYFLPNARVADIREGKVEFLKGGYANIESYSPEICLTEQERDFADKEIGRIKRIHGSRQLIALSPNASCSNKNPAERPFVEFLNSSAQERDVLYLQLAPDKPLVGPETVIPGVTSDGKPYNVRQSAAMLSVLEKRIAVDSFGHHLAHAVDHGIHGNPVFAYRENGEESQFPTRNILLVFSSNPESVGYRGDLAFPTTSGKLGGSTIPCAPCGHHGYSAVVPELEKVIGGRFVDMSLEGKPAKWYCIHEPVQHENVQPCRNFDPEMLLKEARRYLSI